jgi:spermidine/putrescine-binding protein
MKSKKWLVSLGMAVVLVVAFALPACETTTEPLTYAEYVASLGTGENPVPEACFDQAMEEGELRMYDWAAWWPQELYDDFEDFFGITIIRDNYSDLDVARAKFLIDPTMPYDYFLADVRSLADLKNATTLLEFDHDWIPNVNAYLGEEFQGDMWDDPDYNYSVVTSIGLMGYVINTNHIAENATGLGSWAFIYNVTEECGVYDGKLIFRAEMNRVIGSALQYLGYSYNSVNQTELDEAGEELMNIKDCILAYSGWPVSEVQSEECWIFHCIPGDGRYLGLGMEPEGEMAPLLSFLPEEGTMITPMLITIPQGGGHPAAAHLWTNYMYRPDNFAKLIEAIAYSYGHTAIDDLLSTEVKEFLEVPEGYWEISEVETAGSYEDPGLSMREDIWEELRG